MEVGAVEGVDDNDDDESGDSAVSISGDSSDSVSIIIDNSKYFILIYFCVLIWY